MQIDKIPVNRRALSPIFLMILLLGGCIKDKDGCGVIRMLFRYDCNTEGQNLLSAQAGDVRVYLFDCATGRLADVIRVCASSIERGRADAIVPQGVYTAVAWAGSGADLMQGGYADAEMADPAAQSYTRPARTGSATLHNFRMMLDCDALPAGGAGGDLTPVKVNFDDLFYGGAHDVAVNGQAGQTIGFGFIKNTSTLKVKVSGIDRLGSSAVPPLHLFVACKNGMYNYDNSIDEYARTVCYEPPFRTLTPEAMEVDVKIQRLDIGRHSAEPALLYLQKPDTGFDMIPPLNVVETIRSLKNARGDYVYATQADIDREDVFLIEISILHNLAVTVAVNGFEVTGLNYKL